MIIDDYLTKDENNYDAKNAVGSETDCNLKNVVDENPIKNNYC